jgi:magnesium-transporting ATPase (P-type)
MADPALSSADYHAQSAAHVLQRVESQTEGLSSEQVHQRQQQFGANRLTPPVGESGWLKLLRQFNNVLIYVLIVAAIMSWLLGRWTDGGVIFAVVIINGFFGFIQEGKAEQALASIRNMLRVHTHVLRDGVRQQVDSEVLVPGDIVLLESGDRVPADLRLIEGINLAVQESALTGESFSVQKHADKVESETPLAERLCMLYAGTLVTQGRARGVVTAIGDDTEIGKIGDMLRAVEPLTTPLMQQLGHLGHVLTKAILVLSAITFAFGWFFRHYPIDELFMAVVGLAVAAIPEGLPAVITITLAIGVQRMAGHNAIIRRLPAVETLGSVSVICTDKTGTLTRNEMSVQSVQLSNGELSVSGVGYYPQGDITADQLAPTDAQQLTLQRLATTAILCNDARFDQDRLPWQLHGDPTEGALLIFAAKAGLDPAAVQQKTPRLAEIPFESSHGYMATLHHSADGSAQPYRLLLKGAPERVLTFCTQIWTPTGPRPLHTDEWQQAVDRFAARGQRVLALAEADTDLDTLPLPDDSPDLSAYQFNLLGLVGIMDPPREEARHAIAQCQEAGIRVIMVTGDHASTAAAIGTQLGLSQPLQVLTGRELEQLDDADLQKRAADIDIVARATPAHKLRLVAALQAGNQVVAMTGDGVNDAPALKRANIGVAMGMKGTEAAKEAAEMVLADDNFATLRTAVLEGRTVYDNLRKALVFLLPTNGGQALVMVAAIVLGITLPITPVQILWVNMVSAITLSLPLVFDRAASDMMQRSPRQHNESILSVALLFRIAFVSVLLMALTLALYHWSSSHQPDLNRARTVAINGLVTAEMVYLISCRSLHRSTYCFASWLDNGYAILAMAALTFMQLALTYLPIMQSMFGTASLDLHDWFVIVGSCLLIYVLVETEKLCFSG